MRLISRFTAAGAALLASGCLLAACGNDEPAPTPAPSSPAEAAESAVESAAESTTESAEKSATGSSSETASSESTTSASVSSGSSAAAQSEKASGSAEPSGEKSSKFNASVDEAYTIFGDLVPEEIFAEFDRCDPNGVEDSFNCSGSKVGQFQFFKSKTKASQTTQVLTELRSSRVIEDSGSRVVGWSMLGNTAILTVVNNDEGLIMQQMISTDQEDPEERLTELGLV
ncbi:beta-N-acetylglucosaminidase [uncultured Corynebacterium sp.]|uniref:beta-N-acetylglucosaminidase n=1 Tax=uncultured Corynebacterium sp. TaxID=159447 RepID=UPI0025E6E809|nr:beta-N-acetylglucosaminidase [uncultured Corynebacterium sp.]